jgi:hypothetical protein
MKQSSTFFLKGVVVLLALVVLGLCIFAVPAGLQDNHLAEYHPIFWGLYVTAVPFFVAIYQAMKLLGYIDDGSAFSGLSVKALQNIKYCAIVIAAAFAVASPYVYHVANIGDAPGVLAIALVVAFASVVIAVFAAVLQRLLRDALVIKSENDLTV